MESGNGQIKPRARVLVVDDEEGIRMLVGLFLKDVADVTEAPTGDEGIKRAAALTPDLILLDSRLPDMNGADVARALRENDATRNTPIVLVSGDPGRPEPESGITSVLRKPFDAEQLRDCVRRHIS